MKKLVILMLLVGHGMLSAETNEDINKYNKEIIVVSDELSICDSPSVKAKEIGKAKLLDRLLTKSFNIENNRVFIQAKSGKEGWVDVDKTTYLTKEWIRFARFDNIILFYPETLKLKFNEGGRWENSKKRTSSLILDQKLFNDTFFIYFTHSSISYNEYLRARQKEREISSSEKKYSKHSSYDFVIDGRKGAYEEGIGRYMTSYYSLLIDGGSKTYSLSITLYTFKPVKISEIKESERLLAKKILLSMRFVDAK